MTINATEAPNIHMVIDYLLDQSFAPNGPSTAADHEGHGSISYDFGRFVSRAKVHLDDMWVLNTMQRRNYLTTQGCTQAEASRVFHLQSSWPDQQARIQVAQIAKECVARDHELDIPLDKWLSPVDTQHLYQLLAEIDDAQRHLAITFATCSVTDILNGAYREAMAALRDRRHTLKPPAPDGENLPHILHEPNRTIDEQLDDLSNIHDGWNGPDSRGLLPQHVTWLKNQLAVHWSADMPVPFIYPIETGGFGVEWYIGHAEHSLEIDPTKFTALWGWWNSQNDQEHEKFLDLKQQTAWDELQKSSRGVRPNV